MEKWNGHVDWNMMWKEGINNNWKTRIKEKGSFDQEKGMTKSLYLETMKRKWSSGNLLFYFSTGWEAHGIFWVVLFRNMVL